MIFPSLKRVINPKSHDVIGMIAKIMLINLPIPK